MFDSTIIQSTRQFYNARGPKYEAIYRRPYQAYVDAADKNLLSIYLRLLKADIDTDLRVLDLCCGHGRLTRFMSQFLNTKVYGSDFAPGMIAAAQELSDGTLARYVISDATHLPHRSNTFDLVTCFASLNSVSNIERALNEIARILRPGGTCICSVLNRQSFTMLANWVYLIPVYVARKLGLHKRYVKYYTWDELSHLFAEAKMDIYEHHGMRWLLDFLPEFPFNRCSWLFPLAHAWIRFIRPMDEALCRWQWTRHFAQFHIVILKKAESL